MVRNPFKGILIVTKRAASVTREVRNHLKDQKNARLVVSKANKHLEDIAIAHTAQKHEAAVNGEANAPFSLGETAKLEIPSDLLEPNAKTLEDQPPFHIVMTAPEGEPLAVSSQADLAAAQYSSTGGPSPRTEGNCGNPPKLKPPEFWDDLFSREVGLTFDWPSFTSNPLPITNFRSGRPFKGSTVRIMAQATKGQTGSARYRPISPIVPSTGTEIEPKPLFKGKSTKHMNGEVRTAAPAEASASTSSHPSTKAGSSKQNARSGQSTGYQNGVSKDGSTSAGHAHPSAATITTINHMFQAPRPPRVDGEEFVTWQHFVKEEPELYMVASNEARSSHHDITTNSDRRPIALTPVPFAPPSPAEGSQLSLIRERPRSARFPTKSTTTRQSSTIRVRIFKALIPRMKISDSSSTSGRKQPVISRPIGTTRISNLGATGYTEPPRMLFQLEEPSSSISSPDMIKDGRRQQVNGNGEGALNAREQSFSFQESNTLAGSFAVFPVPSTNGSESDSHEYDPEERERNSMECGLYLFLPNGRPGSIAEAMVQPSSRWGSWSQSKPNSDLTLEASVEYTTSSDQSKSKAELAVDGLLNPTALHDQCKNERQLTIEESFARASRHGRSKPQSRPAHTLSCQRAISNIRGMALTMLGGRPITLSEQDRSSASHDQPTGKSETAASNSVSGSFSELSYEEVFGPSTAHMLSKPTPELPPKKPGPSEFHDEPALSPPFEPEELRKSPASPSQIAPWAKSEEQELPRPPIYQSGHGHRTDCPGDQSAPLVDDHGQTGPLKESRSHGFEPPTVHSRPRPQSEPAARVGGRAVAACSHSRHDGGLMSEEAFAFVRRASKNLRDSPQFKNKYEFKDSDGEE